MKLAVNYSAPAVELYRKGRLPVDYLKVPPWPGMTAQAKAVGPVTVHADLRAGAGLTQDDLATVEAVFAGTDTPYVSLHLNAIREDNPAIPLDCLEPAHVELVTRQVIADVELAVARFGADRVTVENVPYFGPNDNFRLVTTLPEVISKVVEETGCGLLFDSAHALVTTHNLGMSFQRYVETLPMHRVRDMHFCGTMPSERGLSDHVAARAEDWEALDWCLAQFRMGRWPTPWLVTLEYGGVSGWFLEHCSAKALEMQVHGLRERCDALVA